MSARNTSSHWNDGRSGGPNGLWWSKLVEMKQAAVQTAMVVGHRTKGVSWAGESNLVNSRKKKEKKKGPSGGLNSRWWWSISKRASKRVAVDWKLRQWADTGCRLVETGGNWLIYSQNQEETVSSQNIKRLVVATKIGGGGQNGWWVEMGL